MVTGYHSDELGNPVSWSVLDISRKAELSHEDFLNGWKAHDAYQNYALFVTPNRAKDQPTFPEH